MRRCAITEGVTRFDRPQLKGTFKNVALILKLDSEKRIVGHVDMERLRWDLKIISFKIPFKNRYENSRTTGCRCGIARQAL